MRRTLLLVAIALGLAAPAGAVTQENFVLRTGADLLALCTAATDDPLYSAAIQMCQGFAVGEYATIQALTLRGKLEPIVCPGDPPPTRNEGIAKFVAWAQENVQHQPEPAVDFFGRFLIQALPCPKTDTAAGVK